MPADATWSCRQCGQAFTFTSGEQDFYASRGFSEGQLLPRLPRRRFGLLALQLAVALDVAFAFVFAQGARLVHARLEATQQLIEIKAVAALRSAPGA